MWKNSYKQILHPTRLDDKRFRNWNISLEWLFASEEKSPLYEGFQIDTGSFEKNAAHPVKEAAEGVSGIEDPLWQRVCAEMLSILGPVAFKDIWRASFTSVSSNKKAAFLTCPTQEVAETIAQYEFVVIEAFKQFFPFLTSLHISVSQGESQVMEQPVNSEQYC